MTKIYCDICGEQLYQHDNVRRFKLKEYGRGLTLEWTRLIVHDYCWKDLSKLIRERRKENENG